MTPHADESGPSVSPGGWAVVSVVCGVVGCLGFTPVVAVVAGGVGVARGGPGKRLAAWGLALGLAWLTAFATLGGLGVWANRHAAPVIADRERGRIVDLIRRLPEARLDRYPAEHYTIGPTRATTLAAAVSDLGDCHDVAINRAAFTNRDGVFGIEARGVARFDRGERPLRVRLFFYGTGWGFSELDWL